MASMYSIIIKRHARRRNVSLYIINADTIEVRAPAWVSESYINELLAKKNKWILQQLAKQTPVQDFMPGSHVLLKGDNYNLEWISAGQSYLKGEHLFVKAHNSQQAGRAVSRFLKMQAEQFLEDRFDYWVRCTGFSPNGLSVRTFKARWGSCDIFGNIKLNWRLIQAPPAVVDYVIIHELCHLQEMNHSAHFWRSVEQFDVDFKKHRRWLKDNGNRLMAVG